MTQLPMFSPDPAAVSLKPVPNPSPDICIRKARGNPNSKEANKKVAIYKPNTKERVRLLTAYKGFEGLTLEEACAVMEHPTEKRKYQKNELSGRFSEASAEGLIFKSGRQRNGFEVYVANKQWVNSSAK